MGLRTVRPAAARHAAPAAPPRGRPKGNTQLRSPSPPPPRGKLTFTDTGNNDEDYVASSGSESEDGGMPLLDTDEELPQGVPIAGKVGAPLSSCSGLCAALPILKHVTLYCAAFCTIPPVAPCF